MIPVVAGGKSSGNSLVSRRFTCPATTGIIRPRKDNILSGMFSKGITVNLLEPNWFPLILHLTTGFHPSRKDNDIIQVCLAGGKSSGNQSGFQKINPPYNWKHTVPGNIILSGMFSKGR